MSYFKRTILITIFTLTMIGCSQREEHYDISIRQVSLIDKNGLLKEGVYDVYTRGDTISRITSHDKANLRGASVEVNGQGKFLMMGLWDNHAHFRGGEPLITQNKKFLKKYIDYGITTVRDAGGDLTPQIQQWSDEITAKDLVGPSMYTSGPKLDGPKARWAGSLEITAPEDIAPALDSLQKLGVTYVKLYDSTISGENYVEIIKTAETRGMITSGHMPFTVQLDDAINAGLDNVEHLYYILKGCSSQEALITEKIRAGDLGFWDSMSQLIATYDEETAQNTFKKLKDRQVFVTPTLHIGNILSYLDEVDHTQDAYLKELSPEFRATYEGRIKSAQSASAQARIERKKLQEFFLKLTKALSDAGVQLLAGSDAGAYNSYTYPGPSLHGELQEMVKAGLTPSQALKNSYNGATFLKRTGYSMQEGSKANLLLLNSNPLKNIKNTLDINLVIKEGVLVL